MSASLNKELKTKYGVRSSVCQHSSIRLVKQHADLGANAGMLLQVRSVPVRKDDEVQVVRGSFKVRLCNQQHILIVWHRADAQSVSVL